MQFKITHTMADIIQLLPDHVANQIAAGEVVQRPASVVKELMENAIDADATDITLIIKDAGKTLVQVIDNGKGMSTTDARRCFERHATSKIQVATDLFNLHTKGFRGEALASIAAVAFVELKTKQAHNDIGELVEVEGNTVLQQTPVACANGTSISVKNLFYNIPARRNFLKSDNVEYNHIVEEFTRVGLTHPEIGFKLYNNNTLVFQLNKGSFKQRICNLFGSNYDERMVPITEKTSVVVIDGYVGKPEFARKTRGEQYFFVNNRFIKSAYFNHAVLDAYKQLIPADAHVSYFINLHVDPARIDVNIHPTKTEIKFEDERIIYSYIQAAARLSVGQYNLAPSLDFDVENSFAIDFNAAKGEIKVPTITVNPNYNPFDASTHKGTSIQQPAFKLNKPSTQNWQQMYDVLDSKNPQEYNAQHQLFAIDAKDINTKECVQLYSKYILLHTPKTAYIIDQHLAHHRVLYEQLMASIKNNEVAIQKSLFPQQIQLSPTDYALVLQLMADFKLIGFELEDFGNNTVVLNGLPIFTDSSKVIATFEHILDTIKQSESNSSQVHLELLTTATAASLAIKSGRYLSPEEMDALLIDWLQCANKTYAPNGKRIITELSQLEIEQKLK